MKNYFIFGLQRSGTNYITSLMTKNFGARMGNRGGPTWKHRITTPPDDAIPQKSVVILVWKNPYKWIESICLRNTVDWLKRQRDFPADERGGDKSILLGPKNLNIINLAKTYKTSLTNWIIETPKWLDDISVKVKYEDLLEAETRNDFLMRVKVAGNYPRSNRTWINPQPGTISQSKDFNEKRLEYYKSEEEYKALQPIHFEKLASILDEDFLSKIGHKQIKP